MEWFSTLMLALGTAWTSGINLYATVAVLGLLQKSGATQLPGGLDMLGNWWIIGIAGFLSWSSLWLTRCPTWTAFGTLYTRSYAFRRVRSSHIPPQRNHRPGHYSFGGVLGGGLAFASHGTKAAARRCTISRLNRCRIGFVAYRGRHCDRRLFPRGVQLR